MKNTKRYALILCTLLCCSLTACGNTTTEEEASKEVTNQEAQVEETVKTPEEEKTETETAEVSDTTGEYEEVIGDVDITRDITIDDCQEMIVGSDLVLDYSSFEENSKKAWEGFERNDIKLLFPSGEFITGQDNSNRAGSEKVGIKLAIEPTQQHIENKTGEKNLLENEQYLVVQDELLGDNDSLYTTMYTVYQLDTDNWISITIEINKYDTEYANNFIEDYIPRFEEMLLSNFQ